MKHDLVLKNGQIITLNKNEDIASWVAVNNGRITALGSADTTPEEALKFIDLNGQTVLPGLFDSHCHMLTTGFFLDSVNLSESRSIADSLALLEAECRARPGDEWVFGVGFTAQSVAENRFPTQTELDRISCGHPIMLSAQTLHGIVLNSPALDRVSIPEEFGITRDADGQISEEVLTDLAAFAVMEQVYAVLPKEKMFRFMDACAGFAARKGVTTLVGLLGGDSAAGDPDLEIVLNRGNELPVDIEIFYQTWDLEKVKRLGLPRIGGCLTLDGAGFEYTMALQEPYHSLPAQRGFLLHSDEDIYSLISDAHRNDIQCAFHAVGDRAIDQLIYLYKQVIGEQGAKDLRHRIEHFCLPSDTHMELLAKLGLVASMQPAFSGLWDKAEGGYYEMLFGRERGNRMEPFPEIIKRGGMVCGGSDSPVSAIDPLYGIACCINNPNPVRNISVTNALKLFTLNAAYAVHREHQKGSIEPGKDADFTVINKNPYESAKDSDLYEMKAVMTIRKGTVTFAE